MAGVRGIKLRSSVRTAALSGWEPETQNLLFYLKSVLTHYIFSSLCNNPSTLPGAFFVSFSIIRQLPISPYSFFLLFSYEAWQE